MSQIIIPNDIRDYKLIDTFNRGGAAIHASSPTYSSEGNTWTWDSTTIGDPSPTAVDADGLTPNTGSNLADIMWINKPAASTYFYVRWTAGADNGQVVVYPRASTGGGDQIGQSGAIRVRVQRKAGGVTYDVVTQKIVSGTASALETTTVTVSSNTVECKVYIIDDGSNIITYVHDGSPVTVAAPDVGSNTVCGINVTATTDVVRELRVW